MMDQPMMACPRCKREYPDFDGLPVIYCEACGFCRHASCTDGACDYCGLEDPSPSNEALLQQFDSISQHHGAYGLSQEQMDRKHTLESEILSRMRGPAPKETT